MGILPEQKEERKHGKTDIKNFKCFFVAPNNKSI
jgi:hypothetical protein